MSDWSSDVCSSDLAAIRDETNRDEAPAEPRILCGDNEIAGEGQAPADARSGAADRGDDRLLDIVYRKHHPIGPLQPSEARGDVIRQVDRIQVATRTEMASLPSENHRPDLRKIGRAHV